MTDFLQPLTAANFTQHCGIESLRSALLKQDLWGVNSDKFYVTDENEEVTAVSCGIVEADSEEDLLEFITEQTKTHRLFIHRIYHIEDKIEMVAAMIMRND